MANPDLDADALRRLRKPKAGAAKMARISTARARELEEAQNKRAAKQRDAHTCQRPSCPHCREYGKRLGPVQGAHFRAKGMGGDKRNTRSQRRDFITLDPVSHAEFERHELKIVPAYAHLLMDGPRQFFRLEAGEWIFEGVSEP
jgi:hypothetical protein